MPLPASKAKERALTLQEREMHRFYQPWLDAHGSANILTQHVNDLAEVSDFAAHSLSDMGYRARQSRDKALTAFAQLAALRLGVRRAMVSLLDSTHQYILAEATKTLSLVDDTRHAEFDELWLGSTTVAKDDAVCQCAMRRSYSVKDEKGNVYTARAAVIPDLRDDPEFQNKPYVLQEPGAKFYAGVPIRSRSGHMIGVYAVSDEKPRAPLSYDELRFMQDIAVSVMDHLEWARDRVDRYKGERIVRGMADFIEGSPNMRVPQEEGEKGQLVNQGKPTESPSAQSNAVKDAKARNPAQSPRLSPEKSHITNLSPEDQPRKRPAAAERANSKREKGDSLSRMLDRAARILRESTLAEGVVFFGPTGNATTTKTTLRAAMSARERFSDREGTGTGTDDDKRLSSAEHVEGDPSTDSDANTQHRSSKILGISLTNKRDATLFHNTSLGVLTLENYFKLYPHGKSFHFSEAGSGLSSEDESASESQREKHSCDDQEQINPDSTTEKVLDRKKKIKMSHQELLKNLPGVRNVIFLPLWDYMDDKMVAGCFLWTSATGRMMNLDDDLSYLRAFGNTIMSEVARITALKDDRAKTTFIASMSHELRSPLHGILGSVEFLQDTAADSYQTGLINSIATCGKTLLDTLDHVLDYAKINKLGRARMRRNAKSNRTAQAPTDSSMESLNIAAEVDLGLVVEEVVEAVCAGHAFKKMHTGELESRSGSVYAFSRSSSSNDANSCPADGSNLRDGEVSVLLDISPRVSWKVRTQPGALRRICMNLLGNALKYTATGFVAVSLRAQENAKHNHIDAVFRVVDSGKGMSEEFQKNRLFIPFSQEDTFQPGTGLGLSIVQQIVDSLGGSIELKSVQNVGTEVTVHLSMPAAEPSAVNIVVDEEIKAVAAKTRGLRLCLLDPNHEKERANYDHIARLDTTLREVCYGWFEMEIVRASSMHGVEADIYMYTEPPSVEYLLQQHGIRKDSGVPNTGKNVPLVIVCLNASEAIAVSANHSKKLSKLGRIIEVIPQPCGPRKMAKVLGHCIRRMEETFGQPLKEIDPASPTALEKDVVPATLEPPKPCLPPRTQSEAKRETDRTLQYLSHVTEEMPPSTAVAFPDSKPDLASEELGKFTDLSADQMLAQQQQRAAEDASQANSVPHVLLVDDNRINLQLLVMFMKKHKFTYAEAQNGQEALDAYIDSCSKKRFDFVLMDISMPVMDGMEATRRIREHEQENGLAKATIIALTGLASATAQQEAESSGIDIYMPKPVKFQELRPLLVRKDSAMG